MSGSTRRIVVTHHRRIEYATRRLLGAHVVATEFRVGFASCLLQFDGSEIRAFWSHGDPFGERNMLAFTKAARELISRAA